MSLSTKPKIQDKLHARSILTDRSLHLLVYSESHTASPQPVTLGVPFPKGMLPGLSPLHLIDPDGELVTVQTAPLAYWPDRSVKWLLLDFVPIELPEGESRFTVCAVEEAKTSARSTMSIRETTELIAVDTGSTLFKIDREFLTLFRNVTVAGAEMLGPAPARILLKDVKGRAAKPKVERMAFKERGPVRATLQVEGRFAGRARYRFVARICFFAGTGLVRLRLTLHNPNRARHRGGLWDLGDPGSILFRELALELSVLEARDNNIFWRAERGQALRPSMGPLEIFQGSSGGTNWGSNNHVDRHGRVPLPFQGYTVVEGGRRQTGLRANPLVSLRGKHGTVSAVIPEFWQQFPKALDVNAGSLKLGLFPVQFGEPFEIQGGEQKSHTIWLDFRQESDTKPSALDWVDKPARIRATPQWYAQSEAIPFFPHSNNENHRLESFAHQAIEGPNSLYRRREIVDEYGWRNFGELYADHEGAYYKGPAPVVSHYNNQYDVIFGALLQYYRTSDPRWLDICDPLARHVIDIDIYHTSKDRAAFNGGLFWHTDHYKHVGTATHRAYSRINQPAGKPYGGGPCNEHNYTTGLLHYYYHTGDPLAREAVLSLANWVLSMDDGRCTIFGLVDDGPTGHASRTTERDYHGPGRGGGNSINALLDGWLLCDDPRYLAKAEQLIRRCIHPHDDIDARDLLNSELRWSYTVFLTGLARYVELKADVEQLDGMYSYARASLLHYAKWMLAHEVTYLSRTEVLEFPTETWPAQDFRKANVLRLASRLCGEPLRSRLLDRGRELMDQAVKELLQFENPATTRATAIALTEINKDALLRRGDMAPLPTGPMVDDFGSPQQFLSQRSRVMSQMKSPRGLVRAIVCLANPQRWVQYFS